jgi:hypothetical protein
VSRAITPAELDPLRPPPSHIDVSSKGVLVETYLKKWVITPFKRGFQSATFAPYHRLQPDVRERKKMEDLKKSVGAIITERLSSPLISTFAISWAFWNSKFFVILISNNSVTVTYKLIQELCFPNWYMSFFNGLVAPATLTIFYLYYLPTPLKLAYEQWSRTQKETKDIKQRWEDEELLGAADAQVLRRNLRLSEGKLEEFEVEVRKLKAELRQSDLKAADFQEVLRTTEEERKKAVEELQVTHAAIDQARNSAHEAEDRLNISLQQAKIADEKVVELETEIGALRNDGRLARMSKPSEAILIALGTGPIEKYYSSLSQNQRRNYADHVRVLIDSGFALNIQDSVGQPALSITAAGLAYLISYALIPMPVFERALQRMVSETKKWNEFANASKADAADNSEFNLFAPSVGGLPPNLPPLSKNAMEALRGLELTKNFSQSELLGIALKMAKS